ncbi:MAG: hypothetical protein ACQEXX_13700 [Bacillota bacterium]
MRLPARLRHVRRLRARRCSARPILHPVRMKGPTRPAMGLDGSAAGSTVPVGRRLGGVAHRPWRRVQAFEPGC